MPGSIVSAVPADADRDHPVTLGQAVRLPAVQAGVPEVLAGHESLDRPLRWVHAGEFHEMASVLKGGELLLTTGMGVPHGESTARQWLADLDDCHVAGLMIELGSALTAVPDSIVSEARLRSMPVIALHQQVAFVDITEAVHREILGHHATVLQRADEMSRTLSGVMLDGGGVADIVEATASLLGAPVILTRAAGRLLFQASLGARDAEVVGRWESARRGLNGASTVLTAPVRRGGDPHWAELSLVSAGGELGEADRAALDTAAPFVALALMRDRELHTLAAQARGEFLFALARGEQEWAERDAIAKAEALGFDRRAAWLMPAIVAQDDGAPWPVAEQLERRLAADVRRAVLAAGRPVIAGAQPSGGGVIVVVGLAAQDQRVTAAEQLAEAAHASVAPSGMRVNVSVGRPEPTWRRLRAALRETLDAAEANAYRRPGVWHDITSPDVAELLWSFRGSAALGRMAERLTPLIEHDDRHGTALMETLEVFFAHGGRKADAARALYLERQSLYKRLARIQTLLDVDLDDEDTRLALHLALRGRKAERDASGWAGSDRPR